MSINSVSHFKCLVKSYVNDDNFNFTSNNFNIILNIIFIFLNQKNHAFNFAVTSVDQRNSLKLQYLSVACQITMIIL